MAIAGMVFFKPKNVETISPAFVSFPLRFVTYSAEVVDTPEERRQGLGGREALETDQAMVFLFDEPGEYGFWMKGMLFPIDIIWVEDGEVVFIKENAKNLPLDVPDKALPVYTPDTPASMVIEVPAGDVEEYGIEVGDLTVFRQ